MSGSRESPGSAKPGSTLEAVYRAHRAILVARLRRVFGDGPPYPDDLVQAAFAKLMTAPDLSAIRDPKAFLFRMAMNLGFDQLAKNASVRRLHGSYEIQAGLMQNPAPETVYLQEQRLQRIEHLIEQLPEPGRDLLRRNRLKGESLSAIAEEQNVSVSTLSRRIAKIMAELKLSLEREELEGRG